MLSIVFRFYSKEGHRFSVQTNLEIVFSNKNKDIKDAKLNYCYGYGQQLHAVLISLIKNYCCQLNITAQTLQYSVFSSNSLPPPLALFNKNPNAIP